MFDTRFAGVFAAGFAARFAAKLAALALGGAMLAGCAAPPAAVLPPLVAPAALLLQGVPPVPQSLADSVTRYTDFAGHAFVDWHPTQREMLVSHRPVGGNIAQLYRVAGPLAEPEALTEGNEPVTRAWYEPREGRSIVLMRGTGGNEAYQLYRLDLPSREQTLLTDPDQRHSLNTWLHKSSLAIISSVPLDRTAAGGRRDAVNTTLDTVATEWGLEVMMYFCSVSFAMAGITGLLANAAEPLFKDTGSK